MVLGFQTAMAAEKVAADVLFARKIQPLFKTKCLACHGENPKKLKGELDVRSLVGLLLPLGVVVVILVVSHSKCRSV